MRIKITDSGDMTQTQIAEVLRKAAREISPPLVISEGSKRFPTKGGREIYEHFDKKFKDMIEALKSDIERIL